MAIVLTGATGFVGSQLQLYLSARKLEIIALSRGADPADLLKRASVVVHLAARVHVMKDDSIDPLAEFRKTVAPAEAQAVEEAWRVPRPRG